MGRFHLSKFLLSTCCFTFSCLMCPAIQGAIRTPSDVLELNERFLEVKDEGHWIVEFYAPWCGHCKRLHSIWEQVGHSLAETHVRVAKLDCTRYTALASQFGISGFPTIKYFRNGQVITYEGDRSKAAILDFVYKTSGPEVRPIDSVQEFNQVYNKYIKSGFFLLVQNSESPTTSLTDIFDKVAKQYFTKAYFFQTNEKNLPENVTVAQIPGIFAFHSQFRVEYKGDESEASLGDWVNKERWGLLPEINFGNLHDMGTCCQKLLVLALLNITQKDKRTKSASFKFARLVERTALRFRTEQEKPSDFIFGWLDGNEIANNIIMGTMAIPSLLVLNVISYQYYLPVDNPIEMTDKALELFLMDILQGGVPALGGQGTIQRLKRVIFDIYTTIYMMFKTQPLLSCCLFGLPLGILSIICYTICSADVSLDTDEVYRDSEDDDYDEDHEKTE